jgi:CxxC motif-containing protein (DUF1111 family)
VIDGGMFTVPEALGAKIIHPFSDFLLHDIGTRDGIFQVGPQDTANKLRTATLWGLRDKARFMHDLGPLSLENAISCRDNEAREPARRFRELSPEERGSNYLLENAVKAIKSYRPPSDWSVYE